MRRRLRIKFAFTRLFSAIMFMLSLGLFAAHAQQPPTSPAGQRALIENSDKVKQVWSLESRG